MAWLSSSAPRRARRRTSSARLQVESLELRLTPYAVSGSAWPRPELITIGFVPDGTVLGSGTSGTITSNLIATFNAKFGSTAVWQNQILKAAQQWAAQTNINFKVLADNGANAGSGSYQQGDPVRADIRIGGYNYGTGSTTLGSAYLPPAINNYSIAGDINLNTGQTFNINTTYDLFTVAMHEFGHALGLYHATGSSAVMYSTYQGIKTGLNTDDIAGIRAVYSASAVRANDSYDSGTGNGTFAAATNLTSLVNATTKTALVTNLDLPTTSDLDYYKVTVPTGTSGTMVARLQTAGLSLATPKMTVYNADQITVRGTATVTGYQGGTVNVTLTGVTAGQTYYLKVQSADATPMSTGRYALALNFGTSTTPTAASPNTQVANGTPLVNGGGQAIKVDFETRVNTTTAGVQQVNGRNGRAVGLDANGNYVVVWASQNQDGSGWGVYGQRFDPDGVPLGGEFLINTTTVGDQTEPTVAVAPTGEFVVVWASYGQDTSTSWGVYGQRYNASGTKVGGEFLVNTTTSGDQKYASAAMNADLSFVVAWSSMSVLTNSWGVYLQRFDSQGIKAGSETLVNTTLLGDQMYPDVAVTADGRSVVAWQSDDQDGSHWGIYARRYNATGSAASGEILVNGVTDKDQTNPSVAMDANGNFVVAYESKDQDGSGFGVFARRFNSSGAPFDDEFQVNTYNTGDQTDPSVAMDADGNLIVVWTSEDQGGPGTSNHTQQFDNNGNPLGNEETVSISLPPTNQQRATVAVDSLGHGVVVWSGAGTSMDPNNADNAGVFMQRYNLSSTNLAPHPVGDIYEVGSADPARPLRLPRLADDGLLVELFGLLSRPGGRRG